MSAAAIRVVGIARELARDMDVTLMAGSVQGDFGVRALERRNPSASDVAGYDAVVAQPLSVGAMRALARAPCQVIYDLFVPVRIERVSASVAGLTRAERLFVEQAEAAQRYALRTGNSFVCPTEAQRDFWLGALAELGRLTSARASQDPTLRDLVDVVPTGLPAHPPERGARSGARIPGIETGDRVLLWAGGIWDWLDPLTVIRATTIVAARRPNVKLLFLGARRPNVRPTQMYQRAVGLARELGVLDRSVFFHGGWVPYDERGAYSLKAEVGVCAHLNTIEARYAFRTRLLDHIWAGLRTVTTRGEMLGDVIDAEGLGRAVAVGDAEAYAAAIEAMLDAPPTAARFDEVRARFAWSRVVEPLRRLVAVPGRPVDAPVALDELVLRGRISLAQGGAAAAVRRQAAKIVGR